VRPDIQPPIIKCMIRLSGVVLLISLVALTSLASETQKGAIVFREEVTAAHRQQLAEKLRAITGWSELSFAANGSLSCGRSISTKGSSTARRLISETLDSATVLILEDASERPDVVFAKVVPGKWQDSAQSRPVFVVLIDFADFDHLMGDRQALEAFNVGWSLLHEIDHVTNDSEDSEVLGHVGECENHINQMRRECHLPARLDYFFDFFPAAQHNDFRTRLVRLAFDQIDNSKKHRRVWVIWDARQVGGLESSKQLATLR